MKIFIVFIVSMVVVACSFSGAGGEVYVNNKSLRYSYVEPVNSHVAEKIVESYMNQFDELKSYWGEEIIIKSVTDDWRMYCEEDKFLKSRTGRFCAAKYLLVERFGRSDLSEEEYRYVLEICSGGVGINDKACKFEFEAKAWFVE